MYHIQLIATRLPGNTKPLFWNSTDPEIVRLTTHVDTHSPKIAHLFSGYNKVTSDDGNMCTVDWKFNSEADWNTYSIEITKDEPELFAVREKYFTDNQHQLFIRILDEKGTIIRSFISIPYSA